MNKYLADSKYAAMGLIDLYMQEILAYNEAKRAFVSSVKNVKVDLNRALLQQLDDMQKNTAQIRESAVKLSPLEDKIKTRQFAFQVLCGALLQIAKQGISVTYADQWKTLCPQGRGIGSETLRNIIWQGRNHAMHYEDNNPHKAVCQCFANLETTFGAHFSLSSQPSTNLAAHLIDILQWHSYNEYERDMTTLLGT